MRVVYWARLPHLKAAVAAHLQAVPGAEVTVVDTLDETLAALPGAQGLVTMDASAADARRVLDGIAGPGGTVRWLHFLSAGREGFEAVGFPPSLTVTYAEGGVAPTVAEHVMMLALALVRRLPDCLAAQADGQWRRQIGARTGSLEGATLGIIGYGEIGRALLPRAAAFGMRVVAASRRPKDDAVLAACHGLDDVDTLLAQADVIVLALALTPETRHFMNRERLARCKPGALIINVARGGVLDPEALAEALASGQVGGAGLDVTEPEPLPDGHPLWQAPNLIITPHLGGAGSQASTARLAEGAAANLARFVAGESLQHVVQAGR
ncbi:D-2-hydroxyacid dehydrogenase [Achromobacter sp. GG226]|uniref:NAD(P)-dependent oxidoreductase n=1 Tax=Verticiella alkaliphila TaxID=2779529 RepID=UPI001C0C19B7|nr:D-2-hydroxyacid dehydrogenase [Verticiella sp. GG226]MBU4610631.1 D-2-hydroxyacid dehydrogenase [Verticiella sp. GG226]